MTSLDSVLKNRDITLPTKIDIVKAEVFPVVMFGCESWTIKKTAEELMPFNYGVGIDFLRVPWTARRSNQSILKGIIPEYSLEGLMLKGKLPILWHLRQRAHSMEKNLDAGKDGRQQKGATEDEIFGWHH